MAGPLGFEPRTFSFLQLSIRRLTRYPCSTNIGVHAVHFYAKSVLRTDPLSIELQVYFFKPIYSSQKKLRLFSSKSVSN